MARFLLVLVVTFTTVLETLSDPQCSNLQISIQRGEDGTGSVSAWVTNSAGLPETFFVPIEADRLTSFCYETTPLEISLEADNVTQTTERALTEATTAHSSNVERVFSMISAEWTHERNRLSIDSIKAAAVYCRSGYQLLAGTVCLRFDTRELKWGQARQACESEGSTLALPDTKIKMSRMQLLSRQYHTGLFVGVHKLSTSWETLIGHSFSELKFAPTWVKRTRDLLYDCALVTPSGLDDAPCFQPHPFICEHPLVGV